MWLKRSITSEWRTYAQGILRKNITESTTRCASGGGAADSTMKQPRGWQGRTVEHVTGAHWLRGLAAGRALGGGQGLAVCAWHPVHTHTRLPHEPVVALDLR